jgi:hypothetical protein
MPSQLPIIERTSAEVSAIEQALTLAQGSRVCGPCTVCCTVISVSEMQKPNYCRCKHLTESGCGIYETRPGVCRTWSCGWLLGAEPWGDERHRPDNLGLIFTREQVPGLKDILMIVHEVWPGASQSSKNRYLLKKLAQKLDRPFLVLSDAGHGLVSGAVVTPGPKHERIAPKILAAFQAWRDQKAGSTWGAAGHGLPGGELAP